MAQPWLRDGLQSVVRILSYMKQKGLSLAELNAMLPDFRLTSRFIPLELSARPGRILQRLRLDGLSGTRLGGMELAANGGWAAVRPLKSGGGLMILAECVETVQAARNASETASELCDVLEAMVRRACAEDLEPAEGKSVN